MGPITLFDKSFLQSLSIDESVLFDHFFFSVISPLFFVETLADLEKAVRKGRTPEQEVGIIADKVPEMSGSPVVHHSRLAFENLLGKNLPMDGRVPASGATPVRFEGKPGLIYDLPPEAAAFDRWQKGEFLEVERHYARAWREELASADLVTLAAGMKAMGIDSRNCKSLGDAKELATKFLKRTDNTPDQIKLAFVVVGAPRQHEKTAVENWRAQGAHLSLAEYAPYAAYVLGVELFFQIALAADLIATTRASNRIDVAYLFYLPFCQIFVSSDKLHRKSAFHFLRPDQSFVWGMDLKDALQELQVLISKMPNEQKELGLMRCAPTPADDAGPLVAQLWDRHLDPAWRSRRGPLPARDKSEDVKILQHLNQFSKVERILSDDAGFDPANVYMIQVQRRIHRRKGSFWQLPKDLKTE